MDISEEKKLQMKNTIRQISRYQGYLFSRYIMLSLLFLSIVYYIILSSSIYSSYILLAALPAPSIFKLFFSTYFQDRVTEPQCKIFIMLKRKYKFNILSYRSHAASFFIISFFIILWQLTLLRSTWDSPFSTLMPSIILCIGVFSRLSVSFYYQIKLHYCLLNNQW